MDRVTKEANMGAPDKFFKWHGNWKSENAKDGFIDDSMYWQETVSHQQLGLWSILHSYLCDPSVMIIM